MTNCIYATVMSATGAPMGFGIPMPDIESTNDEEDLGAATVADSSTGSPMGYGIPYPNEDDGDGGVPGPPGPPGPPGSDAEVTPENVEAAGAVMESDTSTVDMSFVVDEDDMASNSDTLLPTQQSVKAYVDSRLGVSSAMLGVWRADAHNVGGDPSSGHLRWNNATQTSATALTLDHMTVDGHDLDNILMLMHQGDRLLLQDATNSDNYQIWEVSGTPTGSHASTYWSIPVTLVSTSGSGATGFTHNTRLLVAMHHGGDGAGSAQVLQDSYAQGSPSSVWTCTLDLEFDPIGIRVVDSAGTEHVPEYVEYVAIGTVILHFRYAFSGTAYFS